MREILFRGQTIYKSKNNAWYKGSLITESEGAKIVYDTTDKNGWEYVIPKTVGQYTGLKDKNGNKIFEGDVLRVLAGVEAYGVYEFDMNIAVKDIRDLTMFENADTLEIVGNIHDNPELLKGE